MSVTNANFDLCLHHFVHWCRKLFASAHVIALCDIADILPLISNIYLRAFNCVSYIAQEDIWRWICLHYLCTWLNELHNDSPDGVWNAAFVMFALASRSEVWRPLQNIWIQWFSRRCQDGIWQRYVNFWHSILPRISKIPLASHGQYSMFHLLIDLICAQHGGSFLYKMLALWCVYIRHTEHLRLSRNWHICGGIIVHLGLSWHDPLPLAFTGRPVGQLRG